MLKPLRKRLLINSLKCGKKKARNEGGYLFKEVSLFLIVYLFIEERSPETVKEYNDKLVARVHELLGDVSLDEKQNTAGGCGLRR